MTTPPPSAAPKPRPFEDLVATYRDPAALTYLLAAAASLAVLAVSLSQRNVDLGAAMLLALAAPGLLSRWPASPPLVLLLLGYFLIYPEGVPEPRHPDPRELSDGHFRVADLVLAAAAVGYVACQYRLFGIVAQAMPDEARKFRPVAPPTRRAGSAVPEGEIGRLAVVVAFAVVAGQLVWLFLTRTRIEVGPFFPLAFGTRPYGGAFIPPANRLLLLCGLAFFGTVVAGTVFWYWRLHRLRRDEARMILLDAAWDEARRELVRLEARRAETKARSGGGRSAV